MFKNYKSFDFDFYNKFINLKFYKLIKKVKRNSLIFFNNFLSNKSLIIK
jgi:hypothetical protein